MKYFSRGSVEAKDYGSGRTFDSLLKFVTEQVQNDNIGRVEKVDEIIKGFLGKSDKGAVIKSVETLLQSCEENEKQYENEIYW